MLMYHSLDCAKSRLNPESHWLVNGSFLLRERFCKNYLFSVTSLWCTFVNPLLVVHRAHRLKSDALEYINLLKLTFLYYHQHAIHPALWCCSFSSCWMCYFVIWVKIMHKLPYVIRNGLWPCVVLPPIYFFVRSTSTRFQVTTGCYVFTSKETLHVESVSSLNNSSMHAN